MMAAWLVVIEYRLHIERLYHFFCKFFQGV
jgi:hypothetical protein